MKKYKITEEELNFIQYVCECVAFGDEIDMNTRVKELSKRISQITSNLIMSNDNQVSVCEIPVADSVSSRTFSILLN